MITRTLAVLALSAGAVLLPTAPATAAAAVVTVDNDAFTPARVTVRIGQSVAWKFEDDHQHTTTSNQGFWNSGPSSTGDKYTHKFPSAGTYAYHCNIHSFMTGAVRVRMKVDGAPAQGWTVTWASASAPVGRDFDVQYKRKGADSWKNLVRNAVRPSGRFNPDRDGTYRLRARTSNLDTDKSSGWSPVKSVKIS